MWLLVVNGNINNIEMCFTNVRNDQSLFSDFEHVEEGLVGLEFPF